MVVAMSDKPKQLLFSLTKEDFEIQTFCTGGKGGQKQNKKEMGVRIIHPASGARGECREERYQYANRKRAFERLVETKEFKKWHKAEVARRLGKDAELRRAVNEAVDRAMIEQNLKIETF
jgi:protein subunit release factor A